MATIQYGSRKAQVKINPEFEDYIDENQTRNFEPQWNEQVSDENGHVALDTFSDAQTVTKTFDLVVLDASGIDTEEEIQALVGGLLVDDNAVTIGAITSIADSTPAGRALKLTVNVTKYSSVDYSVTS
jgi:predicted O-methyltransferase YrrM